MLRIVHEFLRETDDNGFVLTLYLSRDSDVEFAEELGRLEDPSADSLLHAYVKRHHPHTPINHIQLVDGEGEVQTLSYMSVLAHRVSHPS